MTPTTAFQSRYGFHPCSRQTFEQLALLKRQYWQTVRDFHRWWRWQRKQPQNRRGGEPSYCELFVENRPWFKPRRVHGQDAIRKYPRTLVDRGVLAWHAAAKRPQPAPPAPLDEQAGREIQLLYDEAVRWMSQRS